MLACFKNIIIKKVKRLLTIWEKIFAKYISNKRERMLKNLGDG